LFLFNRLWQQSLRELAGGAIDAAALRGLVLAEPGLSARLVASGMINERQVQLEWRGGFMGARSRLVVDGQGRWGALIADADALEAALRDH
jgi:hypothetical protein